jgi:hypothetical protein
MGAHSPRLLRRHRDIVGGRSPREEELRKAKTVALDEMQAQAGAAGGNAVIAVDSTGASRWAPAALMVSASVPRSCWVAGEPRWNRGDGRRRAALRFWRRPT